MESFNLPSNTADMDEVGHDEIEDIVEMMTESKGKQFYTRK
jgi:hypothetical protein